MCHKPRYPDWSYRLDTDWPNGCSQALIRIQSVVRHTLESKNSNEQAGGMTFVDRDQGRRNALIQPSEIRTAILILLTFLVLFSRHSHAQEREGVRDLLRKESQLMQYVPVEKIEQAAKLHYTSEMRSASEKQQLAPSQHPQVIRLRAIANRLLRFTPDWNPRASAWEWEVNLVFSPQVNAYCAAGGKIAFFSGILSKLQLTDDEVAAIMGHEIAHALREHTRAQYAKGVATRLGTVAASNILGMHDTGNKVLALGAHLLTLQFSRADEAEADLIGMELVARGGYNPAAGVSLWEKMAVNSGMGEPEILRTHPSDLRRIAQIRAILPRVVPLYEKAERPTVAYGPPTPSK